MFWGLQLSFLTIFINLVIYEDLQKIIGRICNSYDYLAFGWFEMKEITWYSRTRSTLFINCTTKSIFRHFGGWKWNTLLSLLMTIFCGLTQVLEFYYLLVFYFVDFFYLCNLIFSLLFLVDLVLGGRDSLIFNSILSSLKKKSL